MTDRDALHRALLEDINIEGFDPMPAPCDIRRAAPASEAALAAVAAGRSAIKAILDGKDRRLMIITGPCSIHDPKAALDYAERVCRRADEVNLKTIVFGSGGARNVPGDFTAKNRADHPKTEDGTAQMTEFCRQLAARIADCKVAVVIEPLRPNESNIVNFVWQGLQMVEDVGSPRIQQLADLFHMMMGREDPESIVKAGDRLKHCHIATKEKRAYPGANDTEAFLPYFSALKRIGYTGGVSCECSWGKKEEFEKNLDTAIATLKDLEARA
jgi:sugar phosphate isomerase/epimerase